MLSIELQFYKPNFGKDRKSLILWNQLLSFRNKSSLLVPSSAMLELKLCKLPFPDSPASWLPVKISRWRKMTAEGKGRKSTVEENWKGEEGVRGG